MTTSSPSYAICRLGAAQERLRRAARCLLGPDRTSGANRARYVRSQTRAELAPTWSPPATSNSPHGPLSRAPSSLTAARSRGLIVGLAGQAPIVLPRGAGLGEVSRKARKRPGPFSSDGRQTRESRAFDSLVPASERLGVEGAEATGCVGRNRGNAKLAPRAGERRRSSAIDLGSRDLVWLICCLRGLQRSCTSRSSSVSIVLDEGRHARRARCSENNDVLSGPRGRRSVHW